MSESPPQLLLENVTGETELGPVGKSGPMHFAVKRGEIGVILGTKETSSLFRLILGLGTLSSGQIVIGPHTLAAASPKPKPDLLHSVRREIGFIFRDKGLISNLTLFDNVDLPARYHDCYHPNDKPGSIAEKALSEIGVPRDLWNLRPDRIDAQSRKLALMARSTVLNPSIIIADDPTSAATSPMLLHIMTWLQRRRREGFAVLVGTSDYSFAAAVADWILHPNLLTPCKDYQDFIAAPWLSGAKLLKGMIPYEF